MPIGVLSSYTKMYFMLHFGATFKIVNHSVEVVHDVVHPLAVSCHYFIAHSCLVLLLILTLLGLLAALD